MTKGSGWKVKRLVCELCKSTDFVKIDGVFVCQVCSCKYSVEEAKKLMFEDGVEEDNNDVSSNAVSSVKVSGLYEVARRARRNGNSSQAAKYYDLILLEEPGSWEAQFYSIYFSSMDCTIAGIAAAAKDIENCLESTIDLIVANAKDENEKEEFLTQVTEDLNIIADLFLEAALDHQVNIDDSIRNKLVVEFNSRVYSIESMLSEFVQLLLFRFGDDLFALQLVDKTLRKSKKACQTAYHQFCRTYFYPEKKELRSTELATVTAAIKANEGRIEKIKEKNALIEKCSDKEACYAEYSKIAVDSKKIEELEKCVVVFGILNGFKDSDQLLLNCKQRITDIRCERKLTRAEELKNLGEFTSANGHIKEVLSSDCSEEVRKNAEACQKSIEEAVAEKERKEKEEALLRFSKKERRKKIGIGILLGLVAALICVTLLIEYIIPNSIYNSAISLKNSGEYGQAIELLKEIDDFKDSRLQRKECYYKIGKYFLDKNNKKEAVLYFLAADDFSDSKEILSGIMNELTVKQTIDADLATAALKADGTVVVTGVPEDHSKYWEVWSDITYVTTSRNNVYGIKADGSVVGGVFESMSDEEKAEWTNVISISADEGEVIGLRSDGTVVSTRGSHSDLKGITDVDSGNNFVVALKTDGTVVSYRYMYSNDYGQCNVEAWTDVVAVDAGPSHTVGLRSDGTVFAVGSNNYGQCNVGEWTDIVAISTNSTNTIGLKSDGTVVSTEYLGDADDYSGQCDVQDWTDIVAISAGSSHCVGLKSDGTVVSTEYIGSNYNGECDVYDWYDIKLP